jgi:predicted hotdog family 3-hydroxylacyl-ACP dehydratase
MIKGEELYELLPQSHPMVMIDQFVSSNEKTTVTSFHIKPDNILLLDGKLSEAGIIENIAQTAAARSGYEAKKNKVAVRTGFIGSIKNLKIHFLPDVGNTIQTQIDIKTVIGEITVISAVSAISERIIAECEMTIILTDSPKNS